MIETLRSTCLAVLLLASSASALLNSTVQWPVYIKYTTVTGYFLQDEPSTNATTFNYVGLSPALRNDLPLTHVDEYKFWLD